MIANASMAIICNCMMPINFHLFNVIKLIKSGFISIIVSKGLVIFQSYKSKCEYICLNIISSRIASCSGCFIMSRIRCRLVAFSSA